MVYNITRPVTATYLPQVPTARNPVNDSFEKGWAEGKARYKNMTHSELGDEAKRVRRLRSQKVKSRETCLAELAVLDTAMAGMHDIDLWAKGFLVFQKPLPCAGTLREAFANKAVINIAEAVHRSEPSNFIELFDAGHIFRLEHDWYKAISKADEFEKGSFKLPFEVSIFEFTISGRAVVALCMNYASEGTDNGIIMQLAVYGMVGWILSANIYRHDGGKWGVLESGGSASYDELDRLVSLIGNQIRAACIALDAEVAVSSLVRESHNGLAKDTKEHPEYEFYTINLANKQRAEALRSPNEAKHNRRLHFRRGHWRHFVSSKTWVRWCLVGNQELGFVDKQYRF